MYFIIKRGKTPLANNAVRQVTPVSDSNSNILQYPSEDAARQRAEELARSNQVYEYIVSKPVLVFASEPVPVKASLFIS